MASDNIMLGENFSLRAGTTIVDELIEHQQGYAKGPERALMSALLFDGVQAYMNYASSSQTGQDCRQFKEAYHWVHDSSDDYVFSFESVCEALGINPDYLRLGLINATNSQTFEWRKVRKNF